MKFQTYLVDNAQAALDEFFRYAKAVPADKTNWEPEGGRSVLSLAREVARAPQWSHDAITARELKFDDESFAKDMEFQQSLADVAACEAHSNANMAALRSLANSLSDEDLETLIPSPFGADGKQALKDMLEYPRWNATYHTGQVAYIQTMYGDKGMY